MGLHRLNQTLAMKSQYSKSEILWGKRCIGGRLELRVLLHGFRISYRCPLHHLGCLSAPCVSTFLPPCCFSAMLA